MDRHSQHHRESHHSHPPTNFGTAFAIGIGLNTAFVLIEAVFGFFSNSVALLADAGHNLSNVLGLIIAWWAATLAKRPPSGRYTAKVKVPTEQSLCRLIYAFRNRF